MNELNELIAELVISLREEEERIYEDNGRRATDEALQEAVTATIVRIIEDDDEFMNMAVDELFGY